MKTYEDEFIKMREDEILNAEINQHEKILYLNNHKQQEKNGKSESKKRKVQK